MEPWIESPYLQHLTPGQTVNEKCVLRVPDGKVTKVTWRLEYGPSWMRLDPLTGVISGEVPLTGGDGMFNVSADFEWQPVLVRPRRPAKAPKPPKPAKTETYEHYRDQFINAVEWDYTAFSRMLDQVGLERDIRDVLRPARKGSRLQWTAWTFTLALGALIAILVLLIV